MGSASMTMAADVQATVDETYFGCLPVNRVSGADVSQWQARNTEPKVNVDFAKMKAMGVQFAFVRVFCKGYYDAAFQRSWAGAKQAGIIRGAYIALDYRANIESQVQKSINWLINDPGELPIAIDFEKLLYAGLGSE